MAKTQFRPQFYKSVLNNGLTLVAERHSHVRGLAVGVWIKVGSSVESASRNGICHAIEHMVFKGTETRNPLQIATALEALGGDLNAFTDREYTCYHASVLSEHLSDALDVLADLVIHPTFPKVQLDREKKILIQEMSMVEETPEDWVTTLFFQTIWKGEALGLPILGNKKTIQALTRGQLLKFYREFYRPENMVVSVSGKFEIDELKAIVEDKFQFPDTQGAFPIKKMASKYHADHKCRVVNSEQLHLMLGYEGVGFRDPRRFELLLLSFYLGGGMSSRLFQEIREKAALAYSVDCDVIPFADSGVLTIYAATQHRSLGKCLSIVRNEILRLKEAPLSEEEVNQIKGQVRGAILLSSDHMETRQEAVGRNEIMFGRYVSIDEVIEEIDGVTPDRLWNVANEIFCREKESVVVLGRQRYKKSQLRVLA